MKPYEDVLIAETAFLNKPQTYPYNMEVIRCGSSYKEINSMMDKAIELKKKWLFIIEDSVSFKHEDVFSEYIKFMNLSTLSILSYMYPMGVNRILYGLPNPGAIILSDFAKFCISRLFCDKFILLDMEKIEDDRLDENLFVTGWEEFVDRLFKKGKAPFSGLYFDVPDSFQLFTDTAVRKGPEEYRDLMNKDLAYLASQNIKFTFESNMSNVVNWIKTIQMLQGV